MRATGGEVIALQTHEAKSATILVADDEEANRELLAHILEREGYQVVLAEDGEEAVTLFSRHPIDLALLDVKMPRQNGFQVCRAIKKNPDTRLIPVVLITGLINTNDRIAGIECGADDYLHKPIRREELTARVRSLLRLKQFTDELENAEGVLFSLALSIEAKDPYTEGHCTRLSKYSVELASALGLPEEERVALRRAGIVHDIGKVAVPERILLKPGPLTDEERKIIEQHPIVGERICQPLRSFRLVLPVIRHHHEKLDGSGYPDGLKGDAIPMTARIMTTVDVYDALTTDRPYRSAHSSEEAFAIMQEEVSKGWWDAQLVAKFRKVIAAAAK
jgi:putative two-component system response regulator